MTEKRLTPQKYTIKKLSIINGAKGTSDLIVMSLNLKFNFFMRINLHTNIKSKLTAAPIQKDSANTVIPFDMPSSHPAPRKSFASPKPIHFPSDTLHKSHTGIAKIGPAIKAHVLGNIKERVSTLKNNVKIDTAIKLNTNVFGIIPCFKSYTVITMSNDTIIKPSTILKMDVYVKNIIKNINPVINSTAGYWNEILLLHALHAPP